MGSGICHFSFLSDCVSSGAFQGFALWALGLCLLGKASVTGAFSPLLGVSGLLVRIGLTILHPRRLGAQPLCHFLIGVPTEGAGQSLATLPLLPKQAREPDSTADSAWVFGQEISPGPFADMAPGYHVQTSVCRSVEKWGGGGELQSPPPLSLM